MKLLVAGAGAFGREHLRCLSTMEDGTLAVADTRVEAAQKAAADFRITEFGSDAASMLETFWPDGIVIATPAQAHLPLAALALRHGIPVLLEKPIAPTSREALELCQLEAASSAFVQPGHILRFSNQHRTLVEHVRKGAIGQVVSIASRRYRDGGHATRYPDIDPVLMTMIHDIDLALWIGEGVPVSATARRRKGQGAHSLTAAMVEDDKGVLWRLTTAWLYPTEDAPVDRVEVIGTAGGIEMDAGGVLRIFGPEPQTIYFSDAGEDPLTAELECFLAGVRDGVSRSPVTLTDAYHGLLAAEMILADLAGTGAP
ncbi:Gfo/Idh/MocA family protein [Mesorhizobium sp. A556]